MTWFYQSLLLLISVMTDGIWPWSSSSASWMIKQSFKRRLINSFAILCQKFTTPSFPKYKKSSEQSKLHKVLLDLFVFKLLLKFGNWINMILKNQKLIKSGNLFKISYRNLLLAWEILILAQEKLLKKFSRRLQQKC